MSAPKIASVYPLSWSQQGMFFEAMGGGGMHLEQVACTFGTDLDVAAFGVAWGAVMHRHAVLRSAIVAKDQSEPLQVVLAEVPVPLKVEDWRARSDHDAADAFADRIEAERASGFDMSKAPLMRLLLVRLRSGQYRFLWTFHHILLDGWCLPLIMRDLFAAYGGAVLPPPVAAYRDYVVWLRAQDPLAAEAYWRKRLVGFTQPTRLGRASGVTTAPISHAEARHMLDASATVAAAGALRAHRLTLNTLAQGLWALILGHFGQTEDAVFGATVSGRPPAIRGVEEVVGPFFNTIAVRADITDTGQSIGAWLGGLQGAQLDAQPYEWCSAGQIHQWSGLPGSDPLFETLLVFENYPVAQAAATQPSTLTVDAVEAKGARTNQLLTLLISVQAEMEWRAVYDAERLGGGDVAAVLELFAQLVPLACAHLDLPVSWLQGQLPADWSPAVKRRIKVQPGANAQPVAARTTTEMTLVRVWEDLFGIAPIGVRDNFFTLGGHSLLVLNLMARIEAALLVKLPPAAIFAAPTIERLALAVAAKQGPWSPLVALKPSGAKRPVFAVHPLGGHVLCYAPLARLWDPDRPLYGLQAPGLEEGQTPFIDMERMADYYLDAIRAVQPQGPYLLAGYSFGGLVAYEMACRLRARGEAAQLVALFDAPNSNTIDDRVRYPDSAAMLVSLFSESLTLDLDALRQMTPDRQLAWVLDLAKQADLVAPETGIDEARRYFDLSRTNQLMAFPGRPYDGPVVLFRGRDGASRLTDDPLLGWGRIATGRLDCIWTPGAHETMLAHPYVETLAEACRAVLAPLG